MKHRGSVGFRLLATALIFITAGCSPGKSLEGAILQVPADGVPAWQIKFDRSGHDNCQIGGKQRVKVILGKPTGVQIQGQAATIFRQI